jgi:hypothetical protein
VQTLLLHSAATTNNAESQLLDIFTKFAIAEPQILNVIDTESFTNTQLICLLEADLLWKVLVVVLGGWCPYIEVECLSKNESQKVRLLDPERRRFVRWPIKRVQRTT